MADSISLGSIQASVGLNLQGLRQDVGETRNLLREMGTNLRSETLKASEGVGVALKSGLTGAVQEAGESAMAGLRRWLQKLYCER